METLETNTTSFDTLEIKDILEGFDWIEKKGRAVERILVPASDILILEEYDNTFLDIVNIKVERHHKSNMMIIVAKGSPLLNHIITYQELAKYEPPPLDLISCPIQIKLETLDSLNYSIGNIALNVKQYSYVRSWNKKVWKPGSWANDPLKREKGRYKKHIKVYVHKQVPEGEMWIYGHNAEIDVDNISKPYLKAKI